MELISTFRTSWPFIVRKFLMGASAVTGITFFIFFQGRGISLFQASFLLACMTIVPVFAEVPTGVFADAFGRKISALVSVILELVCIIAVLNTTSFFILVPIFLLWGVGTTFASGAVNAWAIGRFPQETKDRLLENYFALNASAYSVGMVVAGLSSTLLLTFFDQSSVWWLRFAICACMFALLLPVPEIFSPVVHDGSWVNKLFQNFKQGIHGFRESRILRKLVGAEFLLVIALFLVSGATLQSLLVSSKVPESYWGAVYSISAVVAVWIPILATKIARRFNKTSTYLISVIGFQAALFLAATFFVHPAYAVCLLFFYNISEDFFNPVSSALFQKNVPGGIRATVESFQSAILGVGYTIGMIWGGYVSAYVSWAYSIFFSIPFFIAASVMYWIAGKANSTPERT